MAGALRKAGQALRDLGVPFAVIGGLAFGARGVPRFTGDLDFAVAVDGDAADQVVFALRQRGFRVDAVLVDKQSGRLATVRLKDPASDLLVDLLFSFVGIEGEITAAATETEVLPGEFWPTATRGHLSAMKLLAMRAKDLGDLSVLLPALAPAEIRALKSTLKRIEKSGKAHRRDLVREFGLLLERTRADAGQAPARRRARTRR